MGKQGGKLMSMNSLYKHTSLKCVVVGDGCVGKTCMLFSYAMNRFPREHVPTVFDHYIATVQAEGRPLQLGLVDTAGQEEYDRLRVIAYPGADIFLVCFSVVSPPSLLNAQQVWVPEIRKTVGNDAKIILVGTKTDLRTDHDTLRSLQKQNARPITEEEGQIMARKLKLCKYLECSALTQNGLKTVFDESVSLILAPTPKQATGLSRLMCWKAV